MVCYVIVVVMIDTNYCKGANVKVTPRWLLKLNYHWFVKVSSWDLSGQYLS